jgi:hypothetical protein
VDTLKILKILAIFLVITVYAIGCGSSGGGSDNPPSVKTTTVSGTVLDMNGNPIEGAEVTITSNPVTVDTDVDGRFSAIVEVGNHEIVIKKGIEEIYSGNFTCYEDTPLSIGNIQSSYDPNRNDNNSPPSVNADKVFYVFHGETTTNSTLRELYMVYANGKGNRQLTFSDNGDVKKFFGLSPDGYAVYQSNNSLYSVLLSNPSQATTYLLTVNPIYIITPHAISDDGWVVYEEGADLYTVRADGTQAPININPGSYAEFIGLTSNNFVIFSDDDGFYAIDPAASTLPIHLSSIRIGSGYAVVTGTKVVYANQGSTEIYVLDTVTVKPIQLQLDTGSIVHLHVSGDYAFYSKRDANSWDNLWRAKLDGTDTMQLTKSPGSDDRFVALDSSGNVIYQKRSNSQDDLYSISLSGGIEIPLAANIDVDDTFRGLTPGNHVIIETADNKPFRTITSIKSDGTGAITLAAGSAHRVEIVTPDGWVVYERFDERNTMTSVKYDNSENGSFTHVQGKMGITSDKRIIANARNSTGDLNMYSILPSGKKSLSISTDNQLGWDELVVVIP